MWAKVRVVLSNTAGKVALFTIALICGLILAFSNIKTMVLVLVGWGVICALTALFVNRRELIPATLAILTGLIIAFILVSISPSPDLPQHLYDQTLPVCGRVLTTETTYYEVKINALNHKNVWPGYVVRIYDTPTRLKGTHLQGEIFFSRAYGATNPGQFDFHTHLRRQGVAAIGRVHGEWVVVKERPPSLIEKGRSAIRDRARHLVPPSIQGIYLAMVLGDKADLSVADGDSFRGAGLSHLLVVSGLHVGMVAFAISWFLIVVARWRTPKAYLATLGVVCLYAMLVGPRVSVMRATFMLAIVFIARVFYQPTHSLVTLCGAAIAVLLVNPYFVFSLSFQLSFLAVLAVGWLAPKLNGLLGAHKKRRLWVVALAVQLMTLPLIINSFNYVAIYTVIANVVLVPLGMVTLVVGLLGLLPLLSVILSYPLYGLLWLLSQGVEFFAHLPWARLSVTPWPVMLVVFYYMLLGGVLCAKGILVRRSFAGLTVVMVMVVLFVSATYNVPFLRVTMLDVGQGDAIVIQWPNGQTALIDAGMRDARTDKGQAVVVPYLRHLGVNRLQAMFVSHGHADHYGGLLSVSEVVKVDQAYVSPTFHTLAEPRIVELRALWEREGIPIKVLSEGMMLKMGPGTYIEVFGPPTRGVPFANDENNHSLVLRLTYGQISFLFTGDIESEAENYLVAAYGSRLQSTVLKVPHHGSISSSTKDFIEAVDPMHAVIPVGRNRHGHPHQEVVQRYMTRGTNLLRTDLDGAVTFTSDGRSVSWMHFLENER